MKKDPAAIAKLSFEAFHIPVRVFRKDELLICFPADAGSFPSGRKLQAMLSSDSLTCFTDDHEIFVKLPCSFDRNLQFLCGPASGMPPGDFFRLMQVTYYMLNDKGIELKDFMPEALPANEESTERTRSFQAEALYQKKEFEFQNDSYEVENFLLNMVKRGDVIGMKEYISSIPAYHAGTVANDVLRMQKNYMITTISLVTRAAIEAGLPKDQAFGLSDLYITKLENLWQMKDINQLTTQMLLDFTGRVSERITSSLDPDSIDGAPAVIRESLSYIKSHTNEKLSVESVASSLGYDRSYLSNLFSKTLGFSMSAYITRCKLEESKILLAYTNKSLREISSFLCFSSQSHFQLRFRETFHTTPLKYRSEHAKSPR